ncbi:helix-turn-helix domain-containing protein [Brevibacterium limosum]|uniref:helix-turn-helix domain-containing protein n=1 Tax=Brevibacterium limosum TaxID=2697565 RepID=UPI0014212C01|nr:XRE family transcriptional regulator [Brevibacterium limosum]
MKKVTSELLGRRIRDERKLRGQTQEEVARKVSVDRTVLNKIENGTRRVSALELADIASAIEVRMASFFEEPLPAVVSHRSSQGLDPEDSQIDTLLSDCASEVEFVHELAPFIPRKSAQDWTVPECFDDADAMAERARDQLGLNAIEPAKGLPNLFERIGLLVFTRELGADTADAGTVLLQEGGVTLVNSSSKVGRRRLAAAHELAHFLVADEYTIDWRVGDGARNESLFDRFARGLLLPAEGLESRWTELQGSADLRTAAVIVASEYQVDMATLSRRLLDLEIGDVPTAGDVRVVRTTRADLIEYDLHPGDEMHGTSQPRSFQKAVLRLIQQDSISRERGLELLQGLLTMNDLPQPEMRSADAIWDYVS